ncbi:MAG TPA: class I SAM-dependent methyltransferase, partial [Bryobacteraceae bacterium]|nr:class I SAM-dependent methyltransferase [Bryobacteraceae bacterium]
RDVAPGLVLDVGCGDGHALRLLAEMGWRGTGIDWAEDMLRVAPRGDGQSFVVADAERPFPFRDATFDAVVSVMVLMDLVDITNCARETRRVVRQGGVGEFVILNPEFVARDAEAIYEIGERRSLPPPAEWRAWVRIAPDQPVSTLYVQRPVEAYAEALVDAGWQVTGVRYLDALGDGAPEVLRNEPAIAINTRVPSGP